MYRNGQKMDRTGPMLTFQVLARRYYPGLAAWLLMTRSGNEWILGFAPCFCLRNPFKKHLLTPQLTAVECNLAVSGMSNITNKQILDMDWFVNMSKCASVVGGSMRGIPRDLPFPSERMNEWREE